jgi:hypothetical protein
LSAPQDNFESRRELLAAQIAQQRVELAQAYRRLEKPLHYAESGLRGAGFIRNNPWIWVAAPALFSFLLTNFGRKQKKSSQPQSNQGQPSGDEPKGIKKHAVVWGGRAWQLYQLYRRVRHLLP